MSVVSQQEVRAFIEDFVMQRLKAQERELPTAFSDECDLLLSGLIDSLGILELITALGNYCGQNIDFEDLDPNEMTIVGPLCRFVSAQSAAND